MAPAVITGISLISPAGATAEAAFEACLAGRCAGADFGLSAPLDRIPLATLPPMPELDNSPWPERSAALAVLAARDALAGAGLDASAMRSYRSALVVGTSKAGVLTALDANRALRDGAGGDGRATASLWPWGTPACALDALCRTYRPGGEVHSVVAACAAGLAAVAQGARLIADGRADTVLVVAADASTHPLFIGGFWRMGVLASWDQSPGDACRPFAADRAGFVLSEGAGAVVLHARHAAGRQAPGQAITVAGWACGSEARGLVRPAAEPGTLGPLLRTMLRRAGWSDGRLDLVHAHGTGTRAGDLAETRGIRAGLGAEADRVPVISTKPVTGHMLGAAGLAQVALTALAMRRGLIPPTANLRTRDPQCDLDYNEHGPRRAEVGRAACLANGFGGTVVALGLERDG